MSDDQTDESWIKEAACRGCDPEMFFPGKGDSLTVLAAKAVCAECTVTEECLALATGSHYRHKDGIFGGLTGVERRRLNAKRRRKAG